HELAIQNKDLNIPQVEKNHMNTDRAWTDNEYLQALEKARDMERYDVVQAMQLGRHFGMRIEEATALHSNQLQRALKNGFIELYNTKNGIARDIPLETTTQREIIQHMLQKNDKGRLFIQHHRTQAQAKRRIQDWLKNNRSKFQETKSFHQDDL